MFWLLKIAVQCEAGKYTVDRDDNTCITAVECMTKYGSYAYAATMECSAAVPSADGRFDEGQKENNVYECVSNEENGQMLLDLTGDQRRCVSWI